MPRSNTVSSAPEKSPITADFQRRIEAFGEDGRRWLEDLPAILEASKQRWQLQIDPPVKALSYNYVAPAIDADGRKVILKSGVPRPELDREVLALRTYNGRGSVRLIDADPRAGILLLEHLAPGRMLSQLGPENDEEATRIAAQVMQRLWRPLPDDHQFTTVARWAKGFERLRAHFHGGAGPFPAGLVEEAEAIYERNLETTEKTVLLHGDLHHFNILSAEREPWLAIDPKGVAGDPAYDGGALLRNPIPDLLSWPDLAKIQSKRLDILADELQIELGRLQEWAFAQAVLSAWWAYEDEGHIGKGWIVLAESIRDA